MGHSTSGVVKMLSTETILTIHQHLTQTFAETSDPISPPGVRDHGLLESAVHRQQAGSKEYLKYPTPCSNAASLMFGLCNNHPFYNGNKRTALVAGFMHLDRNGIVLEGVTKEDLYGLMLRIASHDMARVSRGQQKKGIRPNPDDEIRETASWLELNSRRIKKGEKNITFSELYRILRRFGFRTGDKRDNKLEILKKQRGLFGARWKCVYKVSCPGDGKTVQLNEIKAIREALQLTEEQGVDSESFYDTQIVIDTFIRQHRNVLRQLART